MRSRSTGIIVLQLRCLCSLVCGCTASSVLYPSACLCWRWGLDAGFWRFAGSSNTDALFEREIKKYDAIKADVARNVARNEELLAAVSRDAQVSQAFSLLLV